MARVPVFPAALVLLLLLVATGEMMGTTKVADARTCVSPSKKFDGICLTNSICADVCSNEGFQGGYCLGILRLRARVTIRFCFCIKPC